MQGVLVTGEERGAGSPGDRRGEGCRESWWQARRGVQGARPEERMHGSWEGGTRFDASAVLRGVRAHSRHKDATLMMADSPNRVRTDGSSLGERDYQRTYARQNATRSRKRKMETNLGIGMSHSWEGRM